MNTKVKIDWTKPVQTRGGANVKVLSTEARGNFPVIGHIGNNIALTKWTSDGYYFLDKCADNADLINVPKTQDIWINVYKEENGDMWCTTGRNTREEAEECASSDRVACMKITLVEANLIIKGEV